MNNFYVYAYSDQNNVSFYIGKGSGKRFLIYRRLFNNQPFLKRKIKKIGADNVKIHFLHENLTETEAFQLEIFYIDFYGRRDLGKGTLCNLTDGGEGSSGYIHSVKALKKLSKLNRGKKNYMYGKKHSKKARQKISEAMKGNQNTKGFIYSDESKRKMSNAGKGKNNSMYGRKHSKETKKKISEALKGENNPMYGKKHTEKTKRKLSKINKGKKLSEKTKQKLSIAMKLYYAKKRKQ